MRTERHHHRASVDPGSEEAFRDGQQHVLSMIATGAPLSDVLTSLVRIVERRVPGMLCSVLLLDDDGLHVRHGAAPSLPAEYVHAIDGQAIGPRNGSCGTAMFLRTQVIVTDILVDPLWTDYRDVAAQSGLRACWSTPIFSPERRVLGSFAVYYTEPHTPAGDELRLIDRAADLARIAIEQQRSQHALQQSEARNRAILRAIPDWMFVTTTDGVFLDYHAQDVSTLYVPPAAFVGRSVAEVLPPALADRLLHAFARVQTSDEPVKVEYTLGAEEAERFFEACIVRCESDKVLSIVRDITDRKRSELEIEAQRRELAHLSRVATLGELTGALAHELSQPLTSVGINAQAARHLLVGEPINVAELLETLEDIIRSNRRAGAVIERWRALLRKEQTALQPVNMNDVVREVVDLARHEVLTRRVRVTNKLAPDIPSVLGDRVQLQQVALNLVLNACDAMGDTLPLERQLVLATAQVGAFVELVVSDRGPGIPPGQLERVFEPFVTFRPNGLGLGLAISRSILDAHHGAIRAENNPEGGATFRCLLPVPSEPPGPVAG